MIPPIEATQLALVLKEPIGVVGCIVPWNYPLLLLAWKLAPALAAGNTCVCKPSELTPLSTLAAGAAASSTSRPASSTCVAGRGRRRRGDRRGRARRLRRLHRLGRDRQADRAPAPSASARVNLELGGKDPFIVCADVADEIEVAARGGAWAAYLNAGQVCTSAERFYVHDARLRRLRRARSSTTRARCVSATRSTRRPTSGRWCSAAQREQGRGARSRRRSRAGAELVTGGDGAGHESGHFFAPAVVTGAAARDRPAARGDVRPGRADRPGRSLDEAIELANSTRFGLGANVYTRDLEHDLRCMREIKAGTVWFNDPLTDNDAGPVRRLQAVRARPRAGQEGLEAFQETKHVHMESELERKDWWYPYGAERRPRDVGLAVRGADRLLARDPRRRPRAGVGHRAGVAGRLLRPRLSFAAGDALRSRSPRRRSLDLGAFVAARSCARVYLLDAADWEAVGPRAQRPTSRRCGRPRRWSSWRGLLAPRWRVEVELEAVAARTGIRLIRAASRSDRSRGASSVVAAEDRRAGRARRRASARSRAAARRRGRRVSASR